MSTPSMATRVGAIATRTVVGLGAVAAIAASACLGTYFGYQVGSHYGFWLGIIFAGAALGGEMLKPFAMSAAVSAGWRRPVRALLCLAVSLACIVYSLASELSLAATSRGDLVADRGAEADHARDFRADRTRITNDLAAIKSGRSVAEMEPIVKTAKVHCRMVVNLQGRNDVCSKDPALLAELGRAQTRERLQKQLSELDAKRPAGAAKEADPLASTVGFYLGSAGVKVETPDLSRWLYLIPVVFIEITSAFGMVVFGALGGTVPASRKAPKPAAAGTIPPKPRKTVGASRKTGTVAKSGTIVQFPSKRDMTRAKMLQAVLQHLAQHGTIPSQAELVGRFNVPRSTTSRWVGEWETTGAITRTRDGRRNVISATA